MLIIVVAIDSIAINANENIGKGNASEAIETRSMHDAIVACEGPTPSERSRPTTITRSFRTMWSRRSMQLVHAMRTMR